MTDQETIRIEIIRNVSRETAPRHAIPGAAVPINPLQAPIHVHQAIETLDALRAACGDSFAGIRKPESLPYGMGRGKT